jgi:hypothetical protein
MCILKSGFLGQGLNSHPEKRENYPRSVNRDMKLYSILLGWIGILTKSCVSPQVFYGSRRLAGRGVAITAAKGLKPSGQCCKPGSLKPGAWLELEAMVK